VPDPESANSRWSEMLGDWAIPDRLLASAPRSPYFFDPQVFRSAAEESLTRADDTPSDAAAREVLSSDGSVLDVGCGAGAASLRLRPARLCGVDSNSTLLKAFAEVAAGSGIEADTVEGAWPEVAALCPVADVVVCHHVLYNVPDLASFATALHAHARRRVVIELTAVHPMDWMAPYWHALHGLVQPDHPSAEDAVAVLTEAGFVVEQERWSRAYQMIGESGDAALERTARRLCLPAARLDELRRVLETDPPPKERDIVTLWWPA
jgi:SAM-dependent methyltransferase